ncbi:efflux RND transporter periplasmic adaptor subunit [Ferrimonas lipolytica]|uniref:Efflux RND transporter periplasmic adaptor subunit n=1 Tax=Ferrimonas lipolytica TaxID=2724191 RepID=A0A6H1UDB5_9GAMM|nr:efflux RND transporter periplasmic adaptor subunit [Ferrimonas lipolytica]QIZ77097.1 efflux RND transporter periplasmic adaptor subunit [Ferrimonas lipolytica]
MNNSPKYLVLTTLLLALGGCQQQNTAVSVAAPKPVQTAQLSFQPSYRIQHRLVGEVRNQRTSSVGFELSGMINQVHAELGDKVSSGQVLAQLDTDLLDTEALQLDAKISQLKAQIDLNNSTLKRQLALQEKGYQSQQQLDELNSQQQNLLAQLSQAQSALSGNQIRLNKSQLKAPFNGTVSQRQLAPGQVVSAGQPLLTLVPSSGAEARVGVPVMLLNKLGNHLDFHLRHGQQQLEAQLLGQSASVDPVTRTVDLRFALPTEQSWFDGDLIYLDLAETVTASSAEVPISALISGMRGRWNLMVAKQHEGKWQLERRDITILHANHSSAVITGAVEADEYYVTAGLQALVQGQQVTLAETVQ